MLRKLSLFLCLLFMAAFSRANEFNGTIKGKITTSEGSPAGDVTIIIKGTGKGAISREDGFFQIRNLAPGEYQLEISLIGYEPVIENVTLADNETQVINIRLRLSSTQLEEVIVNSGRKKFVRTASEYVAKMPLKNLENSQVYSVVTKDLLKEQLVFTVDDAAKNVPGLQKMWEATSRSGDGGAYYNARGFILQSQLRNGVAGNVSGRIDAANIERIEVIKGPSATLFGSTLTSYGGLINRVTKKPFDQFGGEVSYAGGSYGFNRIGFDVNAPLSKEKDLLFRVNGAYSSEGSFQDNGFEKGFAIDPSLTYRINDRLTLNLDAEWYSGSNTSKQIIFFYYPADQLGAHDARELGIDYKRSYSAPDIYQVSKNQNYFAQLSYQISKQWTSQTNFSSTNSYSDGPYGYYYVVPNSIATGDPSATGADYLQRADQSTAANTDRVVEIQQNFIGDFMLGRMRNRLVGGLDYFTQHSNQLFYGADFDLIKKNGNIPGYENFNRNNLDALLQDPAKVWNWPYFFETSTYSAYVSNVLNITPKLLAMAAVRVDHFDNKGNFDKASGQYSGGYDQTAFSPKFGLLYQVLNDRISLFANYQNGFTNQTGVDVDGKVFKPEQAYQAEGGVKLNVYEARLVATVSYYDIKVKDMVRTDPDNPNFSIQDGTQRSRGFEAEIIANPADGLNIVAGFAYNDSKMEESDDDIKGRRPATAMSPSTANAWISYRLPFGKWKGFGAGIGGNYASENKIVNSVYYGVFTLPSYVVFNAALFYENSRLRAGLKVDNLSNKEYWIGYTTMNPQKLRSITGSIAFKF